MQVIGMFSRVNIQDQMQNNHNNNICWFSPGSHHLLSKYCSSDEDTVFLQSTAEMGHKETPSVDKIIYGRIPLF